MGLRVKTYPRVMTEQETLTAVCAGRSLARFGDGEFKLCRGGAIKSERGHPTLTERLRDILEDSGECLVAIPDVRTRGPKAVHWSTVDWASVYLSDRPYGSAFVSRPDSAPWIDTPDYWDEMATLWRGQSVTVVRGSDKSFTRERLLEDGAAAVREVRAPRTNAWSDYPALLQAVGTPARALICLGPTATVMAVDLCARGVHAIDLGHAGMFYKRREAVAC